jgi:putative transposase
MARKLRVQYPGALYHVMNRGHRRQRIFKDDHDRACFLKTLGEACGKTGWQVHAFCLTPNYFHLVVETPRPNLVLAMKWLLATYTGRFNRRHKCFGHLFTGRYKALIVDDSGVGWLKTVCDYVHLDPVRARLLEPGQKLGRYRWSSHREYLKPRPKRPPWLRVDRLLGAYGISSDSKTGRRHFAAAMEARRHEAKDQEFKRVRRGWYLGDKAFRKKLLARMKQRRGPNYFGEEPFESDQKQASRMLAAELKRRGWTTQDLRRRRKGDRQKVAMAARLRSETTMTLRWIAERLAMGSWTHVSNLLGARGRRK